ncbi:N-acetyltransferase family protein [Bariatricus sp. SGI.154]|uniref:GNAT family N-acetyltransferase n=1 Tax=Bariatricus sp. SGI.154 TaxID=3420549 RepID=UPI003D095622
MKETELTFRYAVKEDVPLILDFIHKLASYEKVPDAVAATKELLEEWIFDKQRAEVLFAMADGKEVGFSFFYQTFPAYLGHGGIYIDDLYIDPIYRGKGYGKVLLQQMAKIALERGCQRLEWCYLNWNQSSINFYLSMGATPLDECTSYRVTGDALVNMLKK